MSPAATLTTPACTVDSPQNDQRPREQNIRLDQKEVEPIAIIGFSSKFPQDAESPEGFWQLLLDGRSAMTEVPKDRFNIDSFYHPNANRLDTLNVRGGHFIKSDLAEFDAPFFSISSTEAASLDPQQRGLLEGTFIALENAGVTLQHSGGSKTGVFVGCFAKEYETLFSRDPDFQPKYQASGTGSAMLANRLSWFYDFRGPSITLDTACSSSLNALHLACSSLRSQESSMAIVAGCNLMLNPDTIMMSLSNLNFLSPDSRCYSFDHRANGYSRGEGFGIVVIKLLSEAIRDGNTIRAVIRATGSNQDGRTPGLTQPSKEAQEALIRDTYNSAGLDPQVTRFFEAHGTGTAIGDTTEAAAIAAVFKNLRSREQPLLVGAVKSNIGHLEGASGLASLIKTVMVLERGVIPPNIWFERPHPDIHADEWNIKFPLGETPWPTSGLRRASVNSFGYGGANAHVILDDALHYMRSHGLSGRHATSDSLPEVAKPTAVLYKTESRLSTDCCIQGHTSSGTPSMFRLFCWSSSDEGGLKRWVTAYKDYLSSSDQRYNLKSLETYNNLAYTLSQKRNLLPWKSYAIAESVPDLITKLTGTLPASLRSPSGGSKLGFVFTGQGAQWHRMGLELVSYAVYEASMKHVLAARKESSQIDDPAISQPLTTVLQTALVDLLASWGIQPSAVVGHSSGEIAAAYCAGAISEKSAWKLAYYRGLLASRLASLSSGARGSMMAVALSEEAVVPYLAQISVQNTVSVACINSPFTVTVSGDDDSLTDLQKVLDQDHIFARRLPVSFAYHSAQMDDVSADYSSLIGALNSPALHHSSDYQPLMYSSVTGSVVSADQLLNPEYWVVNMRSKVRFSDALAQMCPPNDEREIIQKQHGSSSISFLIELGPHSMLRRPIAETVGEVDYISALRMNTLASETILHLAAELWRHGCTIDLLAVNNIKDRDAEMLVDLPAYPFNHSQSYWHESRVSKNFRFRKHPAHELLGTPIATSNSLEAEWKNTIKVSENPWIEDHKFNGSTLYPAAGIVVMAVEAMRQVLLSTTTRRLKGYRLMDVNFMKAVRLSTNTEGTQAQFYLRPQKTGGSTASHRNEFRLYMLSNDEWIENCYGTIVAEYDEDEAEVDRGFENHQSLTRYQNVFARGVQRCDKEVDSAQMYSNLDEYGFGFGPTFQTLDEISYNDEGEATATIDLHAWKNKVPAETRVIQQHVIHPTSLDGVFHLTVTAITRGGAVSIPTMVPTHLHSLWISNSLLTKPNHTSIKAFSSSRAKGFREAEFDIIALDSATKEPLIVLDGYRATAITSLDVSSSGESRWRRLCYSIDTRPDLDLLPKDSLAAYCADSVRATHVYAGNLIDDAELVCLYFMSEALVTVRHEGNRGLAAHLQSYISWMQQHCSRPDAEAILSSPKGQRFCSEPSYRNTLLTRLEQSGPEGKVYTTVGRNLVRILSGLLDPLELLLDQDLLQSFYSGSSFTANYQKLSAFVDLSAHKRPNQSILEIGAGTGGATRPILDILGPRDPTDKHGTSRYAQYTYTDISPGFFQDARDRFADHSERLVFKTLDIEKDPLQQGFDYAAYDLVIASCVLHATSEIKTTLRNAQKLLKPGGTLLLFEPCNLDCSRLSFVFGLLPGWWLSTEKHRRWGPLLSDETWHESLVNNGFSGADISLRDYPGSRHTFTIMTSTSVHPDIAGSLTPKIIIFIAHGSSRQHEMAVQIREHLRSAIDLRDFAIHSMLDMPSSKVAGAFCICLPEVDSPFLSTMQAEDFAGIQHMISASSGVLWLSNAENPRTGHALGFGRSMCSENANLKFITLELEEVNSKTKISEYVVSIFKSATLESQDKHETEYIGRDGVLHINRVVEDNTLNDVIYYATVPQQPQLRRFAEQPERKLALTISSPGLLDTLRFTDDSTAGCFAPDQVEVKVQAVGVNFKNVMVALGQLPDKSLGQECAGFVTQTGAGVNPAKLKVGDRVCCVTHGAFKTYARSHQSSTIRLPECMAFRTAAALPVAFCTAYYSLHRIAGLKQGESILIHAAAGGVGQAAIQLAQLAKADIYVTVGSDRKKELMMSQYKIPEAHILSSRNQTFAKGIMRLTNNRGVDVILNSLSGESLRESFECVAPLGRFIEIGKQDMYTGEALPMAPFLKGVMFSSVDLGVVAEEAPSLMATLMETVISMATESTIKPPEPLNVFRVSEVESAFRFLQSGTNAGKTVIEIDEDDLTTFNTQPSWYFEENATYVISGGLGGLGRSIARWMMSRKAKHLLLLSRSGAKEGAAIALLNELNERGVKAIAPVCDISDEAAVASALAECAETFPPIKGCIQGSMVLRDGLFDNMTLENFEAALRPKVQGTWNLHVHLPRSMDFFILLSSTGGVFGSRGQSNYAAGNTYQDALAQYRVSKGEKCTSLNLGLMLEVGFAAERQSVTESLQAAGYEGIHLAEFIAMLDYYCNPSLPISSPTKSQVVTGVATPASLKSKGRPEIFWMSKPLFRHLRQMDMANGDRMDESKPGINYKALVESADSMIAAENIVARALVEKLAMSLSKPEADIEMDKPVHAYGVDSLVAVELRYWFLKEFKSEVAVFDILGTGSITQLGLLAVRQSEYLQASLVGDKR
ncbi:MAG: hypothetical protein Q9192_005191 [Flavoplaca navasiana]